MHSTLVAYHLRILEEHGLIWREPRGFPDERRVTVRLTWAGAEALSQAARVLARLASAEERVRDEARRHRERHRVSRRGRSRSYGPDPPA